MVWVFASKIVVPVPIDTVYRIRIDISAVQLIAVGTSPIAAVCGPIPVKRHWSENVYSRAGIIARVTMREIPGTRIVEGLDHCGQNIEEDEVVLVGFVVRKIGSGAEVERACEIRCQPDFLVELPCTFAR